MADEPAASEVKLARRVSSHKRQKTVLYSSSQYIRDQPSLESPQRRKCSKPHAEGSLQTDTNGGESTQQCETASSGGTNLLVSEFTENGAGDDVFCRMTQLTPAKPTQASQSQMLLPSTLDPDAYATQPECSMSPDPSGVQHELTNDTSITAADLLEPPALKDLHSPLPQKTAPADTTGTNVRQKSPLTLKERLKNRLLANANSPVPKGPSFHQKLRQEMMEQALRDMEEIHNRIPSQTSESYEGSFYGLSENIRELFAKHRGITKLYEWQDECLSLPSVQARKNLIYSLPTSGGKTLVAEILILKELLMYRRDAILILPFVSIVHEKIRGLSSFAVELDFHVEEYAASKGQYPPKARQRKKSVFVCTIEKANSLINSLIEHNRIQNVGLIVVDELHMLGEGGSRGAILEMSLTKIMHVSPSTQIIGMSATLNNISDLQQFLQAEIYTNNFRPVVLKEFIKLDKTVYEVDSKALCPDDRLKYSRSIHCPSSRSSQQDPDHLAHLVQEVIPQHSCLVFCPTKKNCENVAELVCKALPPSLSQEREESRKALVQALLFAGDGRICPILKNTVLFGVAYHHSGLTMDERKLIEEAYLVGTLCMLACTSTLAAGVNLPAKRVILRSPHVGIGFMTRSQYKQMIGRAGRAGIDSSGESITIIQRVDKEKVLELVGGAYELCKSSLIYEDKKGIRSLLLTTIGLKVTETSESVCQFLRRTLFHLQPQFFDNNLLATAKEALQNLLDKSLVCQKQDQSQEPQCTLKVTKLGRAVFKGSIDIDVAARLYRDLETAQDSLVVANHLHLLYLVTPYELVTQVNPSWLVYLDEFALFDDAEQKVASLIGVSECYIVRKLSGQRINKAVDEVVVKRFYLALILYNLWRQRGIWDVSVKFGLPRGFIQQLLNGASAFASCVLRFCEELEEFWAFQDLLKNMIQRLSYCVTAELIPLLEISGLKIGRARQLFNAGFRTLQMVAFADLEEMVSAIMHFPRKSAKQIIASAQLLLQEKTETLMQEAKKLIAMPPDEDENLTDEQLLQTADMFDV